MGFSRELGPTASPSHEALTGAFVAIGMNFAAEPATGAPTIEDTLLFASITGLEQDDLRTLAVLTTWMDVHSPWVNAHRLTHLVAVQPSKRVRAYWSSIASWKHKDRRYARLAKLHRGPRLDLLRVGTDFQVKRFGEDTRLQGAPLRVPASVLRDRAADVLRPDELARRHLAYRWRIILGPTCRADMWAALQANPSLSATALARATYGSFATAWEVKRDWQLVRTTNEIRAS